MNSTVELKPRLAAVAALVLPERPMADIGTDHGRLPAALVLSGKVPWAIAGDVAAQPLSGSVRVGDGLEHRLGDGLTVLPDGDIGTVVIAGMGPDTMKGILERGRGRWHSVQRFVLQPNHGLEQIRRFLHAEGWALEDESMVRDGRHIYGIMAWSPKGPPCRPWSAIEFGFGPLLLCRRDPLLNALLQQESARLSKAREKAASAGDAARSKSLTARLEQVECARQIWSQTASQKV